MDHMRVQQLAAYRNEPEAEHTHSVIILHDFESNCQTLCEMLREALSPVFGGDIFPGVKFILPNGPINVLGANDALTGKLDKYENEAPKLAWVGVAETGYLLDRIVQEEAALVGHKNIFVGGHGMGCAAGLSFLLQTEFAIGGFFGIGGFMPYFDDVRSLAFDGVIEEDKNDRQLQQAGLNREPNLNIGMDPNFGMAIDPNFGMPFDLDFGMAIDHHLGMAIDPYMGVGNDPIFGIEIDPDFGMAIDPGYSIHVGLSFSMVLEPDFNMAADLNLPPPAAEGSSSRAQEAGEPAPPQQPQRLSQEPENRLRRVVTFIRSFTRGPPERHPATNAVDTPIILVHTPDDTQVPLWHCKDALRLLQLLGFKAKLARPGKDEHAVTKDVLEALLVQVLDRQIGNWEFWGPIVESFQNNPR